MSGWKISNVVLGNGTGHQLQAEITSAYFDALREQGEVLSKKLVEQEEIIILTGMTTDALMRLKHLVENELTSRGY